jgi:hypothetical protein
MTNAVSPGAKPDDGPARSTWNTMALPVPDGGVAGSTGASYLDSSVPRLTVFASASPSMLSSGSGESSANGRSS